MIYSIRGIVRIKRADFVVLEAGNVGFKIFINDRTYRRLAREGNEAELFCLLRVRENDIELYGTRTAEELYLLTLLNSVSGVGPRTALSILNLADLKDLAAAIKEGRPDLLSRASGVGKRTAERIIVELKNKVEAPQSRAAVKRMEGDAALLETLVSLGYRRSEAREALQKLDPALINVEDRLRESLKLLSKRR